MVRKDAVKYVIAVVRANKNKWNGRMQIQYGKKGPTNTNAYREIKGIINHKSFLQIIADRSVEF